MSFIKQLNFNFLASLFASSFMFASLMIITESHGESDSKNVTYQLEINIHYEPLNDRTQQFMLNQTNVFARIAQLVSSLRFIPYGRTYTLNDHDFLCPNNDQNCVTLKHHACIINLYADTAGIQETANFLKCVFGPDMLSVPFITEQCFDQSFVDANWTEIEECGQNGEAVNLLRLIERIVSPLEPPLAYTPWITVNGVYDSSAEINLIQELCDSYITYDNTQCKPDKLSTVVINYETLNTAVSNYFAEQIYPKKQYLSGIADFKFIPYGLTKWNGSDYVCSQGDDQCIANKIHACVINDYYSNESERTINFIVCSLNTTNTGDTIKITRKCFADLFTDDSWPAIETCSTGEKGNNIYGELADYTNSLDPPISYVPRITINDDLPETSSANLADKVCNGYWPIQPSICGTMPNDDESNIRIAFYYNSFGESARQFAVSQLKQFYSDTDIDSQSLLSMITLELIPWGTASYSLDKFEVMFNCPNGDQECYGNRLHACAINKHNPTKSAQFVLCTFEHSLWTLDTRFAGKYCAQQIWQSTNEFEALDECATNKTDQYIDAYLNMCFKTYEYLSDDQSPNQRFPRITINGESSEDAENDLLGVVCYNYQGSKPEICSATEPYTEQTTEETTDYYTELTSEMSTDFTDTSETETETESTTTSPPVCCPPYAPTEPKKLTALSISLISISSAIVAVLVVVLIVLGIKAYRRKMVPTSYRVMNESNGTELGSVETVTGISVTPNNSEWVFQKTQL